MSAKSVAPDASFRPSILFVCLGNICRSPLAELAMRVEAAENGLDLSIDSAGTGDWHVGNAPDPRARAAAKQVGHDIDGYRARQVTHADFQRFDYIIALDGQNLADLQAMAPNDAQATLSLLFDHVPGREGQGVVDPYYLDDDAFLTTWAEVTAGAKGILRDYAARLRA